MNSQSDLDAMYNILSASRRRFVLYRLLDDDHHRTEDLALEIAAWEQEVSESAVDESDRAQIELSLVHKHLPLLDDCDVVETVERPSGTDETGTENDAGERGDGTGPSTVVTAESFERIRPFVERARSIERGDDGGENTLTALRYEEGTSRPHSD